jgi:hypothetical protein
MPTSFLYDTHSQIDKPLALIHLTLETASPAEHATDDSLARRLARNARKQPVLVNSGRQEWRVNTDAMKYWLGNCHEAGLLSRQNAYEYWLMNFVWSHCFKEASDAWGDIDEERAEENRLLLLRWGWLHDGAMLASLCWKIATLGTGDPGKLVDENSRHVEEMVSAVFTALRGCASDSRRRTALRLKIEEVNRNGFKYNTRRHKLLTHLGILVDAAVIAGPGREMTSSVSTLMKRFGTPGDVATSALTPSEIGAGGALFLDLLEAAYGVNPGAVAPMTQNDWLSILPELRAYWQRIERWDRKFLGIQALAELFLVRNLLKGRTLWPRESWQVFLAERARTCPEELTVHVDRFGRVDYLRFTS